MQMGWLALQLPSCSHEGKTKRTHRGLSSEMLELPNHYQTLFASGLIVRKKSPPGIKGKIYIDRWMDKSGASRAHTWDDGSHEGR